MSSTDSFALLEKEGRVTQSVVKFWKFLVGIRILKGKFKSCVILKFEINTTPGYDFSSEKKLLTQNRQKSSKTEKKI
jgi:hypothetical protein